MNVLVIPEDFRKDQFILKPIITALFADLERPRTVIRVCQDPLLQGVTEALKWERIAEVIDIYPMVDIFLLCVDRDGIDSREAIIAALERQASDVLKAEQSLLGTAAWQELEVWLLAGLETLPADWRWQDVRAHRDPKEAYFEPLVRRLSHSRGPGGGRKVLGTDAARRVRRIMQLCPEVGTLRYRLESRLARA